MVRTPLLIAAFLAALPAASALAQSSADCENFKVNAKLLNMRNEPNVFGSIVDVLRDEQIVCIGEITNNSGQQWGQVVSKSEPDGSATETVDGWSNMRYLTPAAMATAPAPADTVPNEPTPVPADTADAGTPADSGDTTTAAVTPTTTGDVPAFDEPWQTGAFPLNGRSLEQLSNAIPLFAPIEGLPEEVWKKPCTGCHQWNKDRLCEQAQTYIANPANIFRVQHPHGGIVKNALFQWASAGCE